MSARSSSNTAIGRSRPTVDTDKTADGLVFLECCNPAGQIGGEPAQKNQQFTYALVAKGRLRSPEQFGNIVVRESPNGGTVRVRDVSRVELGHDRATIALAIPKAMLKFHARFETCPILQSQPRRSR